MYSRIGAALAATVVLALAHPVSAATITVQNVTAGFTTSSVHLGAGDVIIENFEGFTQGLGGASLVTSVGTFSAFGAAGSGDCTGDCTQLQIRPAPPQADQGRRNTTDGGRKWLDSNDVNGMSLTLSAGVGNLFFFLTDPNDQGGRVAVSLNNGAQAWVNVLGGGQGNARVYFVRIDGQGSLINNLVISNGNGSTRDGFGVDDFGTAVPEPATLLLMGTALLGAGIARRRRTPC